jgi:soluble lytic murein transglycosylase
MKSARALSAVVRALVAGTALLFSTGVVCTNASSQTTRVLSRNPATGGAPAVTDADLAPRFSDETIVAALAGLNEGRAREAIPVFRAWLEDESTGSDAARIRFALAHALVTLERWSDAEEVIRECVADNGVFVDYCLYWSAQMAFERGDFASASALCASVSVDSVFGPRSQHLLGRSQLAMGEAEQARDTLEAFLIAFSSAWYRNDVEFDLAAANVAAGAWDEAARILHRLATVNPGRDTETRARSELDAIHAQLSSEMRQRITDGTSGDTVDRAEVLYERHRSDEVIAMLGPVVARLDAAAPDACRANYLIAKSYTKLRRHSDSIPFYESIVDSCRDEDTLVKALYNLGKAYWNVDRDDEGVDAFERIWEEFPNNSYADDALLYAAQIRRGQGRIDDAQAYLSLQIRDYSGGDMLADAVWQLMAEHYRAGDYREAAAFAESVGTRTGENDIYSRGRLAYFRARSLEQISLRNEARALYAEVMRDNPMSFYALLALNRLQSLDPAAAEALFTELRTESDSSEGVIRLEPASLRTDPFFVRGTELLRMGLHELARGELDRLADRYPNEREVGWVVSLLYHRAGAYDVAHHVPGERTGLNLAYPAGSNMERWQIAYPQPYGESVAQWAEERGLDRWLVYAIMREESGFRADIESWANARGLLQLMLPTANDMATASGRGRVTASQLFEPDINIELGTMYMRRLADLFDAHPSLVIAGYNGGQGNVRNWLRARGEMPFDLWVEEIPYSQTRDYVKRVTMTLWIYHWLYDEERHWVVLPFDLSGI